MIAPRLEIDLGKIHHNAHTLVSALGNRGITVTGVTKASLGSPEIADTLLRAGVQGLGDSRIENIERMHWARVPGPMTLIRSPMLSQVDRVVKYTDVSFNTEIDVISKLSAAARSADCMHGIVLMIELGDLREGIMPADTENVARQTLQLPNIELVGIGTNLACRSGVSPDASNMAELSALACSLEASLDLKLNVISGGNSANLHWAMGTDDCGRINDLRLGESILLGREPLHRQPIVGLHTGAITLVAEVIESKIKPSQPRGVIAQTAFGEQAPAKDRGNVAQAVLALGQQDIDPLGLRAPPGIEILAASSDHLIVDCGAACPRVGSEIAFQLNYSALLRAMTSPFVFRATAKPSPKVPTGEKHWVTAA